MDGCAGVLVSIAVQTAVTRPAAQERNFPTSENVTDVLCIRRFQGVRICRVITAERPEPSGELRRGASAE